MTTVLITGSNRGLGLEWVRQLSDEGYRVYATCRHPDAADELHQLADNNEAISIHPLDVTDAEQIAILAADLRSTPIDILISNAGVFFEQWDNDPLGAIPFDDWEETFRVNVLGSARMVEAFLQPVSASDKRLMVIISSHMGSIADITSPRSYAYRSSKAALNATMHGMAHELAEHRIGTLLLHPGWVRTRMGGDSAPLSVEESVRGMRKLVEEYKTEQCGRFFRYDGQELPW